MSVGCQPCKRTIVSLVGCTDLHTAPSIPKRSDGSLCVVLNRVAIVLASHKTCLPSLRCDALFYSFGSLVLARLGRVQLIIISEQLTLNAVI